MDAVGESIPVIDMVHPVVEAICSEESSESVSDCNKKVGLIGTRATISSGLYKSAVEALNQTRGSSIDLISRPTPLLASAIEEGFYNDTIPGAVLEAYLEDGYFSEVDSMILGCTHYPLVRDEVMSMLPKSVEVIDSPKIVALALKSKLENLRLLNDDTAVSSNRFQVSDLTENFRLGAQRFFSSDIDLEEVVL